MPQYEGLSIDRMLNFMKNYHDMHNFMPSERREIVKLPREWIINVGATVVN